MFEAKDKEFITSHVEMEISVWYKDRIIPIGYWKYLEINHKLKGMILHFNSLALKKVKVMILNHFIQL